MGIDGKKDLESLRREWFLWLLWVEVLAVVIMFSQETMGDDIGIPTTGLLCISNCATCPVICSSPPVVNSLPPPPPPPPPPLLPAQYSPPQSYHVPQSPPLSYSYFPVAPPPPPSNYLNIPFAPSPPTNGPHDYSYPYYFFYTSKAAACLSFPASFSYFLVSLLCSSLIFPFW